MVNRKIKLWKREKIRYEEDRILSNIIFDVY